MSSATLSFIGCTPYAAPRPPYVGHARSCCGLLRGPYSGSGMGSGSLELAMDSLGNEATEGERRPQTNQRMRGKTVSCVCDHARRALIHGSGGTAPWCTEMIYSKLPTLKHIRGATRRTLTPTYITRTKIRLPRTTEYLVVRPGRVAARRCANFYARAPRDPQ